MVRRNNKTCIVCSKQYTFCTGCSEFDSEPRWKAIYCDENCKKLFEYASGFLAGEITKAQAKAGFDSCDLSYKASIHPSIQKAIDTAYASDPVVAVENVSVQTTPKSVEKKDGPAPLNDQKKSPAKMKPVRNNRK